MAPSPMRLRFHNALQAYVGNNIKLYFNPPEDLKLQIPCIRYSLSTFNVRHADDQVHRAVPIYDVTLVTRDVDDPLIEKLVKFPGSRFDRTYRDSSLCYATYRINNTFSNKEEIQNET